MHNTSYYIFKFEQNEDKVDFTCGYVGFYLILRVRDYF
jgi:hypothetical protein